jgi:isorenieratene synthase
MPEESNRYQNSNLSLSRRRFIKGGLTAASGVFTGSILNGCADGANLEDNYPKVLKNDVETASNGNSVLILGGGFGGMHAACELLDRGFNVTIIEQSNMLGGKIRSWRDKEFGVPPTNDPSWKGYPRAHGGRAVWGHYHNLREFMGRHGYRLYDLNFKHSTIYHLLDKDGTTATMAYPPPTWPGIFETLDRVRDIASAMETICGEGLGTIPPFMLKMLSFDYDDLEQRFFLDSISFPEWARAVAIPEKLIKRFFAPLADMTVFNNINDTSALYVIMIFRLFAGSYDDMCVDLFMHPPGETYAGPIERYIKARGGKVIYNTPVIKLNRSSGRILSVLAGVEGAEKGLKKWKCNICGSIFESATHPKRCPICGAPASEIILLSSGPPKEYTADYYVVGMDIAGAKNIIAKSDLQNDSYFQNIMKLNCTSVYPVNLWYADCDAWEKRFPRHFNVMLSNYKILGDTFNWAIIGKVNGKQVSPPLIPEYQPEYHNQNINVIETQIADTKKVENLSNDEIARVVHEELKLLLPDLPEPTNYYVNRWDNYSPYRVGYEWLRPSIQSPLDNLFFIGDWVRTDHLSLYMEKTAVSAKMVTNLILGKIGKNDLKIEILPSTTPNKLVALCNTLFDVYI